MKLTVSIFDQVNRRRAYRIVRWTPGVGEYHLVERDASDRALCGRTSRLKPQRFNGQAGRQLCDRCWQEFTAGRLLEELP